MSYRFVVYTYTGKIMSSSVLVFMKLTDVQDHYVHIP
jgi:hypothetical protein